jgi:hypothetical protein
MRWVWIVALGLGLLAWLWVMPRSASERPASPQPRAAETDAEIRTLKTQTAALRIELERLRAELRALPAPPAPPASPATGQPARGPGASGLQGGDDSVTPEPEGHAQQSYREFLDSKLLAEPPDTSSDETRRFATALANVLPEGSAVYELTCRKSLCRVVASHRDHATYQAFQTAAFGSGAPIWNGSVTFMVLRQPTERAPLIGVIYLARGGALPELTEAAGAAPWQEP